MLALICSISKATANDVTYVEWDQGTGGAYLNVTVKTKTKKMQVQCRVELDGRALSSGSGFVEAGVAVVKVLMPSEFRNKPTKFSYVCIDSAF